MNFIAFRPAAIVGAALFSILATAATATTVSLTYNGASATDPRNVTINSAPVSYPGSGDWPKTVGAFGFNMSDSSGLLGDFVAWCLDLGSFLSTSSTAAKPYVVTSDPFSNSFGLDAGAKSRVQALFDANYADLDLTSGNKVAGFQLALWESIYDSDWNLGTGALTASASATIMGFANGFMALAQQDHDRAFRLTFLESKSTPTRHQNLVTASPIPLPAAGFLLLGALGGLGLMARRRKAMSDLA